MIRPFSASIQRALALCSRLALFAAFVAFAGQAAATGRAALVIGNQTYDNAPAAEGAIADARHVAESLARMGYQVFDGYDLTAADTRNLLDRFEQSARAGDATAAMAIYVSAHAVQVGGRGLVAPVDFDPSSLTAATMDGAPVDLLLGLASLAPGRAVVMLDLSRQEGFALSSVIEPGMAFFEEPQGVLVVSSAQPGQVTVGRGPETSPFAMIAMDEMLKPGARANTAALSLAARMRNEAAGWPALWTAGATNGDFALVSGAPGATQELRAQMELEAWSAAEQSGQRADYVQYLRYFPDGAFADLAQQRINAIDGAAAQANVAERTEALLRLTRADRIGVQTRLTSLGYDTDGADGLTPGSLELLTRQASRRFTPSRNLSLSPSRSPRAGPPRSRRRWA